MLCGKDLFTDLSSVHQLRSGQDLVDGTWRPTKAMLLHWKLRHLAKGHDLLKTLLVILRLQRLVPFFNPFRLDFVCFFHPLDHMGSHHTSQLGRQALKAGQVLDWKQHTVSV